MRLSALLAASLAIASSATAAAQPPRAINAGDRIRVTAPSVSNYAFVGTVIALPTDSLVVQGGSNTWHLSRASVTHIDLSRGRKSNALLGAGIGLLVGAGVGALIGSGCDTELYLSSQGECAAAGAAGLGAAGALLGAVSGALIRTERWTNASLDQLGMTLTPHSDGRVDFGISLTF